MFVDLRYPKMFTQEQGCIRIHSQYPFLQIWLSGLATSLVRVKSDNTTYQRKEPLGETLISKDPLPDQEYQ